MAESKRTLAAILAADVAGYSRLMGGDERATVAALNASREIFRHHIEGHSGRVVDTAGDSVLAVFDSVVEAVECALDVQRHIAAHNADTPEDRQMRFRIGINLGDIIEQDDGTIYGDGVNVAARLESLASPGGVCLSRSAHEQVEGKVDPGFDDIGEHQVKNIARPVRVFRALLGADGPRRQAVATSADRPSIAVLAFENLSGEPAQEYFADGIAEDLITELSRLRWLQVTGRNSTFTYKGQAVDLKQVGRDLGVRYVVEGSVRKSGERVRITAQLVDADTGNHIWAERYDRELTDIFALQDEITETLVATLQGEVGEFERERAHRKPPESLDAWEAYQRGLWHLWRVSAENLAEARRLLQHAFELDPYFAQPYAAMGWLHCIEVTNFSTASPIDSLEQALRFSRQAVALDDKDALAHFTLCRVHTFRCEFDAAITEARIAIDLNPSMAQAHYGLGVALWFNGDMEEGLSKLDTAIRLSPRDPWVFAMTHMRAFAYLCSGNFESALEDAQRAARHPAATFWPHATLTSVLGQLDRLEDAKRSLNTLLEIRPDFTPDVAMAGYFPLDPEALRPRIRNWIEGLSKAGLKTARDSSASGGHV